MRLQPHKQGHGHIEPHSTPHPYTHATSPHPSHLHVLQRARVVTGLLLRLGLDAVELLLQEPCVGLLSAQVGAELAGLRPQRQVLVPHLLHLLLQRGALGVHPPSLVLGAARGGTAT